jgi:hypothetical protein
MDKRYTVDEATALLPFLAPTLVELREKFEEADRIRTEIEKVAATNGGSPERDEWSRILARVSELIDRITEWELQLRDISTGLVDFPGVLRGDDVYLCWRLGEPEVAYYHSADDGFAGRRPISDP